MITDTGIGTINLKKYSVDNLTDFDLAYKRIDNDDTMSWYFQVSLNNKNIGIIKCTTRTSSFDVRNVYQFVAEPNNFCIYDTSDDTLEGVKEKLNFQIKKPIDFITKFWE